MKTLTQSGHPFISDPQRRFAPTDCPVCPERCPTWSGISVRIRRNTHQLPIKDFHNEWSKVRILLGLPKSRTISALTWPWKRKNPGLDQKEIILNHIAALEQKWLTPAELKITAQLGKLAENIIPFPATAKMPAKQAGDSVLEQTADPG